MEAIVAVYDDWGIGKDGTQSVALKADRRFFRETTKGACVIVGRKTLADFPGGKPLPNRVNLVLTRRKDWELPGAERVDTPEEAARRAAEAGRPVLVIGGGSVYRQMLPWCEAAYVTKVHITPESDTFFPDLDGSPQWELDEILQTGEENGISYEICRYRRRDGESNL